MKNKKFNNTRLLIVGALAGYVITEADKAIMELGLPPLMSIMGIISLIFFAYEEYNQEVQDAE